MTHGQLEKELSTLEKHRNDLFDKLAAYDTELLNKKPNEKAWSVIQVIEHMLIIERSSIAYIQKKIQEKAATHQTGFKQRWRSILLNRYLRSSKKFPAPVQVVPTIQYASLNEMRELWNAERSDLKALLASIPSDMLSHNWFKHPAVGKLNLMQMLTFVDAHHTHHQSQIERTLKEVS